MFVSCDEQFSTRNSIKKITEYCQLFRKKKIVYYNVVLHTYFSIFILAHNLKDVPTFDLKYINE